MYQAPKPIPSVSPFFACHYNKVVKVGIECPKLFYSSRSAFRKLVQESSNFYYNAKTYGKGLLSNNFVVKLMMPLELLSLRADKAKGASTSRGELGAYFEKFTFS